MQALKLRPHEDMKQNIRYYSVSNTITVAPCRVRKFVMVEKIVLRPEEKLAQLIASGTSLVSTVDAAKILGYSPVTLRKWACYGNGDLTPVHMKNGAKWRLTNIRNLVGA